MRWQEQLNLILAEDPASAQSRERSAFDDAAGRCAGSIVLYGAGNLGRKVLQGLRSNNLAPLAFADNNPALQGKTIEGVPVFAPADAVRQFGKHSVFVVCVWHPARDRGMQTIIDTLQDMGAARVVPFVWLFWKYADTFLPYYLWDLPSKLLPHAEAIRQAADILANEASRLQYAAHLRLRANADFSHLPPLDPLPAYFPPGLFVLKEDECFVDCGAYDGDTILDFAHRSRGRFRRILAFEADPANFRKLASAVASSETLRRRTEVCHAAVGRIPGQVRVMATGQANAGISNRGDVEVPCTTLDRALLNETPTFIKMDIEGAEEAALRGGRAAIIRNRPILAVCIYHSQSDLWNLPLLMREIQPDSALHLLTYFADGFDVVCFAVPPGRLAGN